MQKSDVVFGGHSVCQLAQLRLSADVQCQPSICPALAALSSPSRAPSFPENSTEVYLCHRSYVPIREQDRCRYNQEDAARLPAFRPILTSDLYSVAPENNETRAAAVYSSHRDCQIRLCASTRFLPLSSKYRGVDQSRMLHYRTHCTQHVPAPVHCDLSASSCRRRAMSFSRR